MLPDGPSLLSTVVHTPTCDAELLPRAMSTPPSLAIRCPPLECPLRPSAVTGSPVLPQILLFHIPQLYLHNILFTPTFTSPPFRILGLPRILGISIPLPSRLLPLFSPFFTSPITNSPTQPNMKPRFAAGLTLAATVLLHPPSASAQNSRQRTSLPNPTDHLPSSISIHHSP